MSLYLGKKEIPGVNIGGGTDNHDLLINRDLPDQHPIESITGLKSELDNKLPLTGGLMQGKINMGNYGISNLPDAIADREPVTLKQLKDTIAGIGTVFNFKGSKPSYGSLPQKDNKIGDVWFVEDESVGYIWIEKNGIFQWEKFGPPVDLSGYLQKSELAQATGNETTNAMSQDAVTKALSEKQDKGDYVTKEEVPSRLPNPHSLVFTGAVSGSYDGSNLATINIPEPSKGVPLGGQPGQVLTKLTTNDYDTGWKDVGDATDKAFEYSQLTPSEVWVVDHGLNKYPSITIVDSAETVVVGEITYIDKNNVKINFTGKFSGKAYFN